MSNVVIYHGPGCSDGFCSAWIASASLGLDSTFLPVNYGDNLSNIEPLIDDNDIYILDFSFKKEVLEDWIKRVNKLVLLDHHRSAEADLKDLIQESNKITIRFDMEQAGCDLTWSYFHHNNPAPWIIDYVSDRDRWLWKRLNSKEVNAAIYSYPKNFETWDLILSKGALKLVDEGAAILRYQDQLMEGLMKNVFEMKIGDMMVPVVNSPILQSELGEKLAGLSEHGIGCCCYMIGGLTRFSLRSRPKADGSCVDVSALAKIMGGGGHARAAGFEAKG